MYLAQEKALHADNKLEPAIISSTNRALARPRLGSSPPSRRGLMKNEGQQLEAVPSLENINFSGVQASFPRGSGLGALAPAPAPLPSAKSAVSRRSGLGALSSAPASLQTSSSSESLITENDVRIKVYKGFIIDNARDAIANQNYEEMRLKRNLSQELLANEESSINQRKNETFEDGYRPFALNISTPNASTKTPTQSAPILTIQASTNGSVINGVLVEVLEGDITNEKTEAIINPTDE